MRLGPGGGERGGKREYAHWRVHTGHQGKYRLKSQSFLASHWQVLSHGLRLSVIGGNVSSICQPYGFVEISRL